MCKLIKLPEAVTSFPEFSGKDEYTIDDIVTINGNVPETEETKVPFKYLFIMKHDNGCTLPCLFLWTGVTMLSTGISIEDFR